MFDLMPTVFRQASDVATKLVTDPFGKASDVAKKLVTTPFRKASDVATTVVATTRKAKKKAAEGFAKQTGKILGKKKVATPKNLKKYSFAALLSALSAKLVSAAKSNVTILVVGATVASVFYATILVLKKQSKKTKRKK